MNPSDAMPQDYGLYYNNTYMQHRTKGPVFVTAVPGELYAKPEKGRVGAVRPSTLTPLWPRPGAYNYVASNGTATAVFISRRARRSARRSASTEHYHVSWSHSGNRTISGAMMWAAITEAPYPSASVALRRLRSRTNPTTAVAVSRDMILCKKSNYISVIVRGQVVGRIRNGVFVPSVEGTALCKVARMQLREVNIPC